MTGTVRFGRLAGIPIGIHPLWLLIVAAVAWSLGATWFPDRVDGLAPVAAYALGLVSALLLFGGILLHELGHAVVARRRGVAVEEIDLWLLGGVARLGGEPQRPGDELRFALAGPAVTAALLVLFSFLALAADGHGWVGALVEYQLLVNAMILGFNLLPAFPLDGGRVLRALLWRFGGERMRATLHAASIGRVFALALAGLGLLAVSAGAVGGLWLVAVGAFLYVAGDAETQSVRLERALAGRRVGDLARERPVCVPASATVLEALERGFTVHPFTTFPVIGEDGRAVGLLTLDRVRTVPADERRIRTVGQLAETDHDLIVEPATPIVDLLARPAFARTGRAVVVDRAGHAIGLLSRTDIARIVRVGDLLGDPLPDSERLELH